MAAGSLASGWLGRAWPDRSQPHPPHDSGLPPPACPGARTAVVHAASPAPEQDAPGGAGVGVVPQGSTDVREGLLVVAGLVHAPLRADSSIGTRHPHPVPKVPEPAALLAMCKPRLPCRRAWGSPRRGTSRRPCPCSPAPHSGSPHTPLRGQAPWVPVSPAWVSCPPQPSGRHSLLSWLMEQGSVSRSRAAGQFPARQESTKSEAVPSGTPMLVVKSSVVSPLKLPQSPEWPGHEGGRPASQSCPASPHQAPGRRPAPAAPLGGWPRPRDGT